MKRPAFDVASASFIDVSTPTIVTKASEPFDSKVSTVMRCLTGFAKNSFAALRAAAKLASSSMALLSSWVKDGFPSIGNKVVSSSPCACALALDMSIHLCMHHGRGPEHWKKQAAANAPAWVVLTPCPG